MRHCTTCKKELRSYQGKYCSNTCQHEQQYRAYIQRWQAGQETGQRGKRVTLISKHLRRYLLQKYKNKCMQCGWAKTHPTTGLVPLEVNHIDGNADNNHEDNLELLCPNCHALTPTFRNLNRGKGRNWRK